MSEAREVYPFIYIEPNAHGMNDFGAYPRPADAPDEDPKAVAPAGADSMQDLIPPTQDQIPLPTAPVMVEPPSRQSQHPSSFSKTNNGPSEALAGNQTGR